MFEHAIAFQLSTPAAAQFTADANGADPLTYEKELIYEGDFQTKELKFAVDAAVLDHWRDTFDKMQANSVDVPMPVEHTTDPEKRRATLTKVIRRKNVAGKESLFGIVKFRDLEAAKLATSSNVSVYVPPDAQDGKGNVYKYPITHVAFTDYPVIPALGKFTALAASLVSPIYKPVKKALAMSLMTLAEKLGLKVADKDEPTLEAEIVSSITTLQRELEALKAKPKDGEEDKDKKTPPVAVAAGFVKLMRDNREMRLSQLVSTGCLTPAAKEELAKVYLADDALALACSQAGAADAFDALCATFAKNGKVLALGEHSGAQGVALAASLGDATKNPMLAAAERKAKEHADAQPRRR